MKGKENESLVKAYNRPDYIKKAISELQGISSMIIYDGKIEAHEIEFIHKWLNSHTDILDQWPITVIHNVINNFSAKHIITTEDRAFLLDQLSSFAAGPELPKTVLGIFDQIPKIQFNNKTFVFTGKLNFSSRKIAQEKVQARGGLNKNNISPMTNYLVVGELGSDEWKFSRFGRKIEEALRIRDDGGYIKIITEKDFVKAVTNML